MPYVSHHFIPKERDPAEPPWGVGKVFIPDVSHHFIPKERNPAEMPWGVGKDDKDGGSLTTYNWMHRGLPGLPAKPMRNHTTNHFDNQTWRTRSDYKEKFFTPQAYSRHAIDKASPFRNHKPHASIQWPLEPHKNYMIWKPKLADPEQIKAYSAPSMLRHFKENNWRTTTQTTYQNYFAGQQKPGGLPSIPQKSQSSLSQRQVPESALGSRDAQRPATEDTRKTPPHLRTMYRNTFAGDPGRPSTDAKIPDHSWRNIRY